MTSSDKGYNIDVAKLPCYNPARTHRLPTRFHHMADISVFLKNEVSEPPFTKSQRKKMNSLLKKFVFEVVTISNILTTIRIFNSRFINKIKNEGTVTVFEKSRLVIQAYNNYGKEEILNQSPTIQ